MNSEAEIGEGVVYWLESHGWDVYQEVKIYSGIADIIAVNGNLLWAIECKKSMTLKVMDQARGWRTHYRSIAVPRTKRINHDRRLAYDVARRFFKVGVLEVQKKISYREEVGFDVIEVVPSPLMREHHRFSKRIRDGLVPEQKVMAKAGTKGGDYYTPYKGTMVAVRRFIEKNPGCTMKMIMDNHGKMHYASDASARSNIPKNLMTIESDWCRVDKSERPYKFYIKES